MDIACLSSTLLLSFIHTSTLNCISSPHLGLSLDKARACASSPDAALSVTRMALSRCLVWW
jgi:hypothetical protein